MKKKSVVWFVVGLGVLPPGCKKHEASPEAAPSAVIETAPSGSVIKPEDLPELDRAPTAWPIPQGPRFAIMFGEGIGPIRFGATTETVERLMEAPCETKDETSCRYIARGVEFFLADGAVTEIRVHRPGRPTTPAPKAFGIFNGRTPDGIMGAMLKPAALKMIGPPLKVEPVKDGGAARTVEIDTYDGLRVEYDILPNGQEGIGSLDLVPRAKAAAAGSAKPATKPAPAVKKP